MKSTYVDTTRQSCRYLASSYNDSEAFLMWMWFPKGQSLILFLHMGSGSFKNFRKMTKSEMVLEIKICPARANFLFGTTVYLVMK